MKKELFFLMVAILITLSFVACGCQEEAQVQAQRPTLRAQLISLDNTQAGKQWKEAFGDSVETAQSFNLALLNDAFTKFNQRITALEAQDPNEIADLAKRVKALEESQPETVAEIPKTADTVTVSCMVHNCDICRHKDSYPIYGNIDPNDK